MLLGEDIFNRTYKSISTSDFERLNLPRDLPKIILKASNENVGKRFETALSFYDALNKTFNGSLPVQVKTKQEAPAQQPQQRIPAQQTQPGQRKQIAARAKAIYDPNAKEQEGFLIRYSKEVARSQGGLLAVNIAREVGETQWGVLAVNIAREVGCDHGCFLGVNVAREVCNSQDSILAGINIVREVGGDQRGILALNFAKRIGMKREDNLEGRISTQAGIINYAGKGNVNQYGLLNVRGSGPWYSRISLFRGKLRNGDEDEEDTSSKDLESRVEKHGGGVAVVSVGGEEQKIKNKYENVDKYSAVFGALGGLVCGAMYGFSRQGLVGAIIGAFGMGLIPGGWLGGAVGISVKYFLEDSRIKNSSKQKRLAAGLDEDGMKEYRTVNVKSRGTSSSHPNYYATLNLEESLEKRILGSERGKGSLVKSDALKVKFDGESRKERKRMRKRLENGEYASLKISVKPYCESEAKQLIEELLKNYSFNWDFKLVE
jgi:hypothetical protein